MAKIANVKKDVKKAPSFKPDRNVFGGLNLGCLVKVEVLEEDKPKIDDKGIEDPYEYAGCMIPSLRFTFVNHVLPDAIDKAERIFQHTEKVIISTLNNGQPMKPTFLDQLYNEMFDRIVHIYTEFAGCDNYQELEDLPEIDETAPAEKRVKQFKNFFNKVADAFNKAKGGKPVFVNAQNIPYVLWLKLLPNNDNGYWYDFPVKVKQGFIELYRPGVPPVIEVKANESLELRVNPKEKKEGSATATTTTGKVVDTAAFGPNIAAALSELAKK
ncbi:hypothetical protein DSECCO2_120570 [anaerobic digester metagenome]